MFKENVEPYRETVPESTLIAPPPDAPVPEEELEVKNVVIIVTIESEEIKIAPPLFPAKLEWKLQEVKFTVEADIFIPPPVMPAVLDWNEQEVRFTVEL